MSTHIDSIEGRYEESHNGDCTVNYDDTELSITRFSGGKKNGRMIQLTLNNDKGYIQLTEEQVHELVQVLSDSFDDEIYPSE